MGYEVRPVGSVFGENDEVVKIDKNMKELIIITDRPKDFAIVVSMTCMSHKNTVKSKLIVPNVSDYQEAFKKASERFKLSGEWATNVGVTLFKSGENFKVPEDWTECETQFEN